MMRGRELDPTWIEEAWPLDLCRTAASPKCGGPWLSPGLSAQAVGRAACRRGLWPSPDPAFSPQFTWCLDACIRERFVDSKRARELQGFLDGVKKGHEQVLG